MFAPLAPTCAGFVAVAFADVEAKTAAAAEDDDDEDVFLRAFEVMEEGGGAKG